MTRLDQAFLKAYRQGSSRTPPRASGPLHWSPPESHAHGVAAYGPSMGPVPAPHGRFGAASGVPAREAAAPAAAPLEPAFEVPRFAWPVLVRNLISANLAEFNAIGTELASRCAEGRRTLLVSGSRRGEGRSTLVLTLAHVASARGLRVALVDADFPHLQLAELLNIVPQVGWEEVFAGVQPLSEALVESVEERITLLTPAEGVADLRALAGGRLAPSLTALREAYDLVLIDTPPLDSDAAAIDLAAALVGARIDDALVIREVQRTTDEEVQAVGRRLAAAGIARWERVENFAAGR